MLDAVQRSKMFPDCKHFVDMSCIFTPAQTLADFDMFTNCRRNDGSLRFLQMFVEVKCEKKTLRKTQRNFTIK